MANKEISGLTAAAALDGTETLLITQGGNSRRATSAQIGVWRHDTLTITAATSGSWDIPAGTTEIQVMYAGGSISASGTAGFRMRQAADSAEATFTRDAVINNPGGNAAGTASSVEFAVHAAGASGFIAGSIRIMFPRSASVKTSVFSDMSSEQGQLGRTDFAVCDAAEDHDQLKFSATVNCTLTLQIFYR